MDLIVMDQLFSGVLEVHGDPVTDDGLDLAEAPVGSVRVAHERAGKEGDGHFDVSIKIG